MDHYLYCFSCHIPLVGLTSLFRVTALNVNTSCLGKNPEVEVLCTFSSSFIQYYWHYIWILYITFIWLCVIWVYHAVMKLFQTTFCLKRFYNCLEHKPRHDIWVHVAKYSDMFFHYLIGKEFTSSILRILSICQSRVEIMRMPQPTWRYLITSMVNFEGVCWPAALAESSPPVFRA